MIFFSSNIFANESNISNELINIQKVIDNASQEFELVKKEKDLKKLAEIAKNLYENHQKIKKLLNTLNPIILYCNGEKCENPVLQQGDKLKIVFNLSFPESEEYEHSELIWQIQQNKKVILTKTHDFYEKGGVKSFEKEILIGEEIKRGKYRIAMHHKTKEKTFKADVFFKVKTPLKVKPIIVSTKKFAKASDLRIYPDEDIYIITGFKRDNINQKVNIDVKLLDKNKNKTLVNTSFIRPKDNSTNLEQSLRFKIPASKLYANQKLEFSIKLYSKNINPIIKKISIPIDSFKLKINIPDSLLSGKIARYSIAVPKKFVKPYKVDIEPSGAILISHKTNLSGTIEAINKTNENASIYVKVTDAKGLSIANRVSIDLRVKKSSNPTVVKKKKTYRYGDKRERKVGSTVYYEVYNGSSWDVVKKITYYSNGQKRSEKSNPGPNGKPRSIKTWWENGNINFIGDYYGNGSMEGVFYYKNNTKAFEYTIHNSSKLKGILKTLDERKVINACIYSARNYCEYKKYGQDGLLKKFGKKNQKWIEVTNWYDSNKPSRKTIREPGNREEYNYDKNGNLRGIYTYLNGKKYAVKEYWKNGQLSKTEDYWLSGNIRKVVAYDQSGRVKYILNYDKNGNRR